MFDVGGGELLLIILAIIVLFGPQKLPEIAQLFGKGIKKVRDAQAQFNKQMNTIKSEINTGINQNSVNKTQDSYDKKKHELYNYEPEVISSAKGIKVEPEKTIESGKEELNDNLPQTNGTPDNTVNSGQKESNKESPLG